MGEVKGKKRKYSKEYDDFLMEFMYHEDKVFTSRMNLFLVAESLLLLSFVTLVNNKDLKIISYYLNVGAIIITFFYSMALWINLMYMKKLQDAAINDNLCLNYKKMKEEIYNIQDVPIIFRRPNIYLGLIPLIFLGGWFLLFIYLF